MAINVDKGAQNPHLQQALQNQTPAHVENLEVSQEELKKEKIKASTERINRSLLGGQLEVNPKGDIPSLLVTHYTPVGGTDTQLNPELLAAFLAHGQFGLSQEMQMELMGTLMLFAQSGIEMSEVFHFVPFIAENDEVKNKMMKILVAMDKLMKSGGDTNISDILLFGGEVDDDGIIHKDSKVNISSDKDKKEFIENLFSEWDKQVSAQMNQKEPIEQPLSPNVPSFTIDLFDKATLFAIMVLELNRNMRENQNLIKQSLIVSRQNVNEAAREGIIQKGQEALAAGVSASAGQMAMALGGAGMQIKSGINKGKVNSQYQQEAPQLQKEITQLKGDVQTAKIDMKSPDVKSSSDQLATKEARLEELKGTRDLNLERTEPLNVYGQTLQTSAQALSMFVNAIGEQRGAIMQAAITHSEQTGQTLSEIYEASREGANEQKQEFDAALRLLREFTEMDMSMYAAVRL